MDFNDIDDQIALNEERLKDESERYSEIRSRIGYISIVYTLFAAFSYQLISYFVDSTSLVNLFKFSLVLFLLSFAVSIICSIVLLVPASVAYKELPEAFYKTYKEEYLQNGMSEEETNIYLKHSYNGQLETAVKHNFDLNNRKSKFHYYSFLSALIALIPYLICIGIYIANKSEDVTKVELTNPIFIDMAKDSINSKEKHAGAAPKTVDTSKVIAVPPVYVRENKDGAKEKR